MGQQVSAVTIPRIVIDAFPGIIRPTTLESVTLQVPITYVGTTSSTQLGQGYPNVRWVTILSKITIDLPTDPLPIYAVQGETDTFITNLFEVRYTSDNGDPNAAASGRTGDMYISIYGTLETRSEGVQYMTPTKLVTSGLSSSFCYNYCPHSNRVYPILGFADNTTRITAFDYLSAYHVNSPPPPTTVELEVSYTVTDVPTTGTPVPYQKTTILTLGFNRWVGTGNEPKITRIDRGRQLTTLLLA